MGRTRLQRHIEIRSFGLHSSLSQRHDFRMRFASPSMETCPLQLSTFHHHRPHPWIRPRPLSRLPGQFQRPPHPQLTCFGTGNHFHQLTLAINLVGSQIDRKYRVSLHIKDRPEILFNDHGVNRPFIQCGKAMNLVNPQGGCKWIDLEGFPNFSNGFFLSRGQTIELPPKSFRGPKFVFQLPARGGSSSKAISIATCRPSEISFNP